MKPIALPFRPVVLSVILFCLTPGARAVDQYANRVIAFSTQYSETGWSAAQTLGAPNTDSYGDIDTSWTAATRNGTHEFLELGFETAVYATGVTIRETDGNGFVYQVDVVDTSNALHTVWTGTDTSQPGTPVDFAVSWPQTGYPVAGVKVYVDTDHDQDNYEEIDSVQLHGALAVNPVPTVQSIGPSTSFRESGAFTLTVNGTDFLPASVVRWNGSDRPTTYVSATQITAAIPASDVATPSSNSVTVFNPTPGGGTSNAATHTVSQDLGQWASLVLSFSSQYSDTAYSANQALGAPDTTEYADRFTAWAPRSANGTQESITLAYDRPVFSDGATIRETYGNGFVYQIDAVDVNGALHTVWTGTDTSQPGQPVNFHVAWPQTAYATRGVKIYTNTDHDLSAYEEIDAVQLQGVPIVIPAPTLMKVAPSPIYRVSPDFNLVVTGANFQTSSVVRWNGADRATTFVSGTTLLAAIPTSDTTSSGNNSVTVFTPTPGGGVSAAVTVAVGPLLFGDADASGTVNLADAVAVLRAAAGLKKAVPLNGGDVAPSYPATPSGYGDGKLDIQDAIRIARFVNAL